MSREVSQKTMMFSVGRSKDEWGSWSDDLIVNFPHGRLCQVLLIDGHKSNVGFDKNCYWKFFGSSRWGHHQDAELAAITRMHGNAYLDSRMGLFSDFLERMELFPVSELVDIEGLKWFSDHMSDASVAVFRAKAEGNTVYGLTSILSGEGIDPDDALRDAVAEFGAFQVPEAIANAL